MKILYLVANKSLAVSVAAFARSLAQKSSASITVMYVSEKEKDLEVGKANLAEIWEKLLKIPIEVKLKHGNPVEEFLNEIEKEEYDLVLVESRRRQRFFPGKQRIFVKALLRRSPLPVLLVRHGNIQLEHALVCTGGQDISLPVVEACAALAQAADLYVTLLYVGPHVPEMYAGIGMQDDMEAEIESSNTPLAQHLQKAKDILTAHGVKHELKVCHGVVHEEIIRYANQDKYDLIVIGATERVNQFGGMLLADVSQEVIQRAESAVLVVK